MESGEQSAKRPIFPKIIQTENLFRAPAIHKLKILKSAAEIP